MLTAILLLAAGAAQTQDLEQLDAQISQFTGASVGEEGGAIQPVDKRLRLKSCSATPNIDWHNGSNQTLLVRCPDPSGWKIYVPIRQNLAAPERQEVAIAISRGDAVSREGGEEAEAR